MLQFWLSLALVVVGVVATCVIYLLRRPFKMLSPPVSTLVVLGSGGHTTEMFKLLTALDVDAKYKPVTFLVASNDKISQTKLERSGYLSRGCELVLTKRSRQVGQSYVSSVFTTLWATVDALRVYASLQPDVVLCNGPGTCVPICFVAKLNPLKRTVVVFVESFCRTETLSLTGMILYHGRLTDKFLVQWRSLQSKYPRSEHAGLLV